MAREALRDVAGGRLWPLPVTVRFWDGSELCSDAAAVVVVRRPTALVHLLHAPNQLGLARAWVDGSLDVDGDLEAVLKTRRTFAGVQLSVADDARVVLAALRVWAYVLCAARRRR